MAEGLAPDSTSPARPPVVMLVAPDRELADLVRDALLPEGFEVVWARSPDAAGQQLAEHLPDLLLLDVEHGSLADTTAMLARMGAATLPLVLLVGPRLPTVSGNARLAGWLAKPFSVAELVATVRRVTGARSTD